MAQGYKQLVSALERRYDYHSARAVAAEALELAGLEKRSSYDGKEWAKLLKSTASAGDDLQAGIEAFHRLLGVRPVMGGRHPKSLPI